MATAYAKQTGRIGVCLATSGPGGIHLLQDKLQQMRGA
jgi:thiamine pyrophosphate-dependent acetolactate synthase large subunit-like protein